jgi:hypothetical protein
MKARLRVDVQGPQLRVGLVSPGGELSPGRIDLADGSVG